MKTGCSVTSIDFDSENFGIGNLRVFHISIKNLSATGIGTTTTTPFADTNLRPKQYSYAIGLDYKTGLACRLCIRTNGTLVMQESKNIPSGNNEIRAVFIMPV